jgi:hypothetical protein
MARRDEILESLYEKTTPAPNVPLAQFKADKATEFASSAFTAPPDPPIPVVPTSCAAAIGPGADDARQAVVDQWTNVINPVWHENAYYDSLCEDICLEIQNSYIARTDTAGLMACESDVDRQIADLFVLNSAG